MNLDAAIADAARIERENVKFAGQFLIRTNVEDEGWTTDGIFGPDEARAQVEAILQTEQIANHEGHHFEYRVYALEMKNAMPRTTIKVDRPENAYVTFYVGGTVVLRADRVYALNDY